MQTINLDGLIFAATDLKQALEESGMDVYLCAEGKLHFSNLLKGQSGDTEARCAPKVFEKENLELRAKVKRLEADNAKLEALATTGVIRLTVFNHKDRKEITNLIDCKAFMDIMRRSGLSVDVTPDDKFKLVPTDPVDLLLQEVQALVRGPREKSYGDKLKNFTDIAMLQSVVAGVAKEPHTVALEMICVKLARLLKSPDHYDSLVDIIGYVMCYRDIRKAGNYGSYSENEQDFINSQ